MLYVNKWLLSACVIFLAIVAGLLIFILTEKDTSGDQLIINADVISKNAHQQRQFYQSQVRILSEKNNQLQAELLQTKKSLQVSKRKTNQREKAIQELISPIVDSMSLSSDDSLRCDSLRYEVAAYIQEVNEKDSMYERQIDIMDSVLRVKDSTIVLQDQVMDSLSLNLRLISFQSSVLASENNNLKRKERKRKVAGTLKIMGVAVAVGVVTSFFNNR